MRFWSWTYRAAALLMVLTHVCATEASAEFVGRSFGRRPSNFGFGGIFFNRNGQRIFNGINIDNLQETGFSRLKASGNQLVEVSRDGTVNRIFFDSFGRLFGVRDPQTVSQLTEFFLNNVDKLRGNQGLAVRRFLARSGAGSAIFGGIAVDLKNIVQINPSDSGYAPEGDQSQMAMAALNYLLNTISQSSQLMRVGPQNVRRDGLVGLNLNGFIRGEVLAALTLNNPYSCGTGRVPLHFLIARAMDPTNYYNSIGAPQTFQQLSAQLGTEANRRFTVGNKILIAPADGKEPESLVGRHPERILEVQNTRNIPGGALYMTYDNAYNQNPGSKADSASVKLNGIDTNITAGEGIFTKPNGFLGFWLSTADGKRQNSAPVEIAQNVKHKLHIGDDVSAPVACFDCHNNGLLGGGVRAKAEPDGSRPRYTDNFNLLTSRGLNRQGHFTTNAVYDQRRARDSRIFRNALIRSGSFWPDKDNQDFNTGEMGAANLLGGYVNAYRTPLDMKAVAKELGTTPEVAAQITGRGANGVVSREVFEQNFCNLLAQARQPGGTPQAPIDQRRLASGANGAAGASNVTPTSQLVHNPNGGGAVQGASSRPVAQ